eukprot:11835785-Heterocapsa_arctica.AAC.1
MGHLLGPAFPPDEEDHHLEKMEDHPAWRPRSTGSPSSVTRQVMQMMREERGTPVPPGQE